MTELKKTGSSGDAEKIKELRKDMETKLERTKEDLKKMAGAKTGGAATNAEVKDTLPPRKRGASKNVMKLRFLRGGCPRKFRRKVRENI